MSFIHQHVSPVCPCCVPGVSPVCQETHKVSENKTLSLFLRTHISKNGETTEMIQICVRYDVISAMRTHGQIRNVDVRNKEACSGSNMVCVYISMLTLRANLYWREYV